ncbi:MAG: uroporphyrinogen decarboxylase family protein [Promethearchaeota archaeon]
MALTKRNRVFKTLELDGEPDMVPIHTLGFEQTGTAFAAFKNSKEREKYQSRVKSTTSNVKYYITEQRFWNVDLYAMDPWPAKMRERSKKAPPEYPDCRLNIINGKLYKIVKQVETGIDYSWYIGGYYTSPEIVHSYWDQYGRPTELINDRVNYSPKVWEGFVEALSPYFYPAGMLPVCPHEFLFEGMSIARVAYYIRKNPAFIHEVMSEYANVDLEIIKRFGEAGVDLVWLFDDLGYKGKSLFSIDSFKKFILPYYKKIYDACHKNGMLIIQHSCGYIDKLLPYMADAGLDAIQALEPAAGVDLKALKEKLGDKICFIGGMDSSRALNFGTPKDVEEDVKKCIKAAAPGGGYFAGPSHNILNVPWENVLALRDAIEKYRKYPLRF